MKLDNENQRKILLGLIAAAGFPGTAVDDVYSLKKAIETATIDLDETETVGDGEKNSR